MKKNSKMALAIERKKKRILLNKKKLLESKQKEIEDSNNEIIK